MWVIEFPAPAAVVGDMTASPDLAPVDSARIRAGVIRMRAALADGSLHHHLPADLSPDRWAPAIDVVRAWASGDGFEAQRRACGVCSTPPIPPRPRDHR